MTNESFRHRYEGANLVAEFGDDINELARQIFPLVRDGGVTLQGLIQDIWTSVCEALQYGIDDPLTYARETVLMNRKREETPFESLQWLKNAFDRNLNADEKAVIQAYVYAKGTTIGTRSLREVADIIGLTPYEAGRKVVTARRKLLTRTEEL